MNKELPETIDFIFKKAIDVYFGKEDKDNAILIIHKEFGTNINSCGMYIRIISSMLKGERYERSLSSTAADNILKNFYSYENGKFFDNSIQSLKQYINHHEKNDGITKKKLREVLSKWSEKMTKG